jgi:hypothetical protein
VIGNMRLEAMHTPVIRAVPTLSDDTRTWPICYIFLVREEVCATLTLVKKKTTRDMAKMSFSIQLLVTTHRMTMPRDKGPSAHPGEIVGA